LWFVESVTGQAMKQKRILALAILACLIVPGCAVNSSEFGTEQTRDESQAAYARCVAVNGADSTACDAAKQHYQSSERSYEQNSTGIGPERPQDPSGSTDQQ
jgi:hypothetical protein